MFQAQAGRRLQRPDRHSASVSFKLLAEALPSCKHAGEWHSHHLLGIKPPKRRDIRTVVRGMATPAALHRSKDRRGLPLRLPDATLLLGADFPASSPLVLSGPQPSGLSWSLSVVHPAASENGVAAASATACRCGRPLPQLRHTKPGVDVDEAALVEPSKSQYSWQLAWGFHSLKLRTVPDATSHRFYVLQTRYRGVGSTTS